MKAARRLPAALGAVVLATTALTAATVISSTPALATSYTVTSTTDAPDAAPGDGTCAAAAAGGGGCTLRAAVQESQAHPGPTTIELPAGTYTLGSLLDLHGEALTLHGEALTLHGADRGTTVIDGGSLTRLFDAGSGTSLTLQHLTLANGHSDVEGGAVRSYDGSLTLDDVAVNGCAAEANGGGLFAAGSSVTITGSSFKDNTGLAGGALAVTGGTLSIASSAFTHNVAFDVGGAVSSASAVGMAVTGSTFTNNTAEQSGGAVFLAGASPSPAGTDPTYTIGSSTFTGNDAFGGAGGAVGTDGMSGPGAAARLALADSTFDSNSAANTGGAVSSSGPVTTTGLTLRSNTAATDDDVHAPNPSSPPSPSPPAGGPATSPSAPVTPVGGTTSGGDTATSPSTPAPAAEGPTPYPGTPNPAPAPPAAPTASPIGTATASASPVASPSGAAGLYHPLTPARIVDTRRDNSPVSAAADRGLVVTGAGGIPASGVSAVVLAVTVPQPIAAGDLELYPLGSKPAVRTSNLNWAAKQTTANLVTVAVGQLGKVGLSVNTGSVHTVVDVLGWYGDTSDTSGARYTALTPTRLLDTGGGAGKLTAGADLRVPLRGKAGVPDSADVTGVVLNVTAEGAPRTADLQVYPTGARPAARTSNTNLTPGRTAAVLVNATLGRDGSVELSLSRDSVRAVIDVVGYYSSSGSRFVPMAPVRLRDRDTVVAGQVRPELVSGGNGIPASATSVAVNVTGVGASKGLDLQVYPTGSQPARRTSVLNLRPGQAVPNLDVAALSGGSLTLSVNTGQANVILDAVGYFTK